MLQGVEVTTRDLTRLRPRTRKISLKALQSNLLPGGRRSAVLGRGMDYEESRKYAAGDDVRHIDWRVTARTGTAHTKVFREERQRGIFIVVDLTESMRYGTRTAFKSVIAAEAAAIFAWAAHDSGDQVAILPASGGETPPIRPAASLEDLHRQLDGLAQSTSKPPEQGGFDLAQTLAQVDRHARAGDLAIVLSDFFALSESALSHLALLRRYVQLLACWIVDPTEQTALPQGTYPISDGDQYSTLHLSSSSHRGHLQHLLDERCDHVKSMMLATGLPAIELRPGEDPALAIALTLQRSKRLGTIRR